MKNRLGNLPVILTISAKFAKILSLLKFVKFTQVFVSATSMVISLLAYGWAYGPAFAVGIIVMLFVHELGHVIAMRQKGLPLSVPVFIPFLGAAIFTKDFGDRTTEAYIGYGGPLLGTIGALICTAAWYITQSPILLVIAFIGIYLNLFNMIPIRPFDGGRIIQVMGRHVPYIGMLILVIYTAILAEPSLMMLWVIVLMDMTMPLWWRSIFAFHITFGMMLLFIVGYGSQFWWLDALDCAIASLFTGLYIWRDQHDWLSYKKFGIEPYHDQDQREYPPTRTRYSWLAIYLVSVISLWTMLWYLLEQLPRN